MAKRADRDWSLVSVRIYAERDYAGQYHVYGEASSGAAQVVLDHALRGISDDPCGSSALSPLLANTAKDAAGWARSALPGASVTIDLPL